DQDPGLPQAPCPPDPEGGHPLSTTPARVRDHECAPGSTQAPHGADAETRRETMANLNNYGTGETIREATMEEMLRSIEAAANDGGAGVIEVDGVRCYVDGDRVEAGAPGTEDHDTGRVVGVDGGRVTVGWDSGARTTQPAEMLRAL